MSDALEQPFQAPPPPPQPPTEPPAKRPARLLPVGIAVVVFGAIILAGGLFKFIPGGTSTGALAALAGLVLVGLSFIPLPLVPDSEPPCLFSRKFPEFSTNRPASLRICECILIGLQRSFS